MRSDVKRGLVGLLVLGVTLAGVAVLAWQLFGLAYVERRIVEALAERGVAANALTVRSVGVDRAVMTDLDLDLAGGVTIARIEAEYGLAELARDRRVDRVVLSGLRLDLSRPPMPPEDAAAETAVPAPLSVPAELPVGSVEVEDGIVTLATPLGDLDLDLALKAESLEDGGIAVTGKSTVRGAPGALVAPFAASVSPLGGFEAALTPLSGHLGWRGAVLEIGGGTFTLAGTLSGLERAGAELSADVTLPDGRRARLEAAGRLDGDDARVELTLASADPSGRLTATLTGRRDEPAEGVPAAFRGRLDLAAEQADATGDRLTADLAAVLEIAADSLRLISARPARISRFSTGALAATVTLGGQADNAFEAALGRVGGGWTLAAAGPYRFSGGGSELSGAVDLAAAADQVADSLAARIAGVLELSGSLPGAVSVDGGRAGLDGRLAIGDGEWRFDPDGCQTVAAARLTMAGRLSTPDGVSGCLAALADRPLIAAGPDGLESDALLRADAALMLLGSGARDRIAVELAPIEATVALRVAGEAVRVDVGTADAALRLPAQGIALDGVALTAGLAGGPGEAPRLDLRAATLRSLADPAWFAPLRFAGEAAPAGEAAIGFRGTAQGAAGALIAALHGRHDLSTGAGRIDIRLDPVTFAPKVRQPADLAPALAAAPVKDVAGSIAAEASIAWGERLSSSADVTLDAMELTVFGAQVRGISGTLHADRLFPLTLPEGQLLAIAGAEAGLSLDEGALAFGLVGDRLTVHGMGFGLAGGSLAVEGFETVFGGDERSIVVILRGIDLALLSEQFRVEGLSMTGRLNGRLPIRLIEDTISIENGVLESTEPGVIQYVSTLPIGSEGEGGVALLLSAVRNFHYDGLQATVNGRTGDDLQVALRLAGANPELYDGFPIALNVNLSGALDQVLRSGLRSLAIGADAGSLLRGE